MGTADLSITGSAYMVFYFLWQSPYHDKNSHGVRMEARQSFIVCTVMAGAVWNS